MTYQICSNNVNVRCAVDVATKTYGYIDDAATIVKFVKFQVPYTIEYICDMADLLDEIHHALIGN